MDRVRTEVRHTDDVDEEPDDTDPLMITALFLGCVVVAIAGLFCFAWLMYAGN